MTASLLPGWAELIRRKYVGGEASMFLLHLNVFDRILHGDRDYSLTEFLAEVLLENNKENIIVYDPAAGVRFVKANEQVRRIDELRLKRAPRDLLPILETVLFSTNSTALIVTYAPVLVPAGETSLLSDQDRMSVVTFHRWSLSSELSAKDNVVFLQTEALPELNRKLVENPVIAAVEIPLPDQAERASVVARSDPSIDPKHVEVLARHTAGLRSVQIASLLTPQEAPGLDDGARLALIRRALGTSRDAEGRAQKLASLTRGMDEGEIRHLINPDLPTPQGEPADEYAEILKLVDRRKREAIEKECAGLIEFVDARHGLDAVGGNDGIKDELRAVADAVRSGTRSRIPMGLLFVGPMGCGKSFVASCFIKEAGLPAVKLKNFRSKWVGSTEANLEKVLGMVRSLGPIVLIIDEGDRAFGGGGENDGGTSSRVIARIKEFMSDPENRGRVLFLLMTNRPDKLDVDIKRAGRLDRKIPFFYADAAGDVEAVLNALLARHEIDHELEWERDRATTSEKLVGYSNADLEAVVLLASDLAGRGETGGLVTPEVFAKATSDYLPAQDIEMLRYMELLAVFETSRRSMLPQRYRDLTSEELNRKLRDQRMKIGPR